MRLVLLNFSHSVVVSVKQLVDRCRTRPHLRSGRRTADALDRPAADEPPLPGRRPVPGQHVTHGRMAPPPGSRGRYRIDCCAYATPDPGHPASRLRTDPPAPIMRPVPAKQQCAAIRMGPARGQRHPRPPRHPACVHSKRSVLTKYISSAVSQDRPPKPEKFAGLTRTTSRQAFRTRRARHRRWLRTLTLWQRSDRRPRSARVRCQTRQAV